MSWVLLMKCLSVALYRSSCNSTRKTEKTSACGTTILLTTLQTLMFSYFVLCSVVVCVCLWDNICCSVCLVKTANEQIINLQLPVIKQLITLLSVLMLFWNSLTMKLKYMYNFAVTFTKFSEVRA